MRGFAALMLRDDIEYQGHRYDHIADLSMAEKRTLEARLESEIRPNFTYNHEDNYQLVDKLFRAAQEKNIRIALMDMPTSPIAKERSAKVQAIYEAGMEHFSELYKAPYIKFVRTLDLGEEEFYDLSHVRPSARKKFEAAFFAHLSALFEQPS